MENPRPEKVAVVDEVREQLLGQPTRALLTEYRGLDVAAAGRRCAGRCAPPAASTRSTRTPWCASPPATSGLELDELLTGPTAIAFVGRPTVGDPVDGGQGAARLRQDQPAAGGQGRRAGRSAAVDAADAQALADVPTARGAAGPLAGALAAPMQQFAGLLAGAAPQLRLRPAGAHRPGRRSRRRPSRRARGPGRARRGRRARGRRAETPAEAPEAEAAAPQTDETPAEAPPSRRRLVPRQRNPHGRELNHGHQGRDPRRHRQHDRARAQRAAEGRSRSSFGVTAAAPVAVAAAGPGRWRRRRRCRRGEGRVRRRPHRRRRQEDPGHQGGARAHEPRPQGGQGPRRRRAQARAREGAKEDAEKAKEALEAAGGAVELK